jgi:hypothetical protein
MVVLAWEKAEARAPEMEAAVTAAPTAARRAPTTAAARAAETSGEMRAAAVRTFGTRSSRCSRSQAQTLILAWPQEALRPSNRSTRRGALRTTPSL